MAALALAADLPLAPRVGRDTVVAVDFSDISKEFGGKGMEGMEPGFDASRKTVAMGHDFCVAAAVSPESDIVSPLHAEMRKGRKQRRPLLDATLAAVSAATGGNGVFTLDRAADGEESMNKLAATGHRCVVRVNKMDRDVFGTGKSIADELSALPFHGVTLRRNGVPVDAKIRWKPGAYPVEVKEENAGTRQKDRKYRHLPVLVVESRIRESTVLLYMLPGKGDDRRLPTQDDAAAQSLTLLRQCAIQAAQAYLLRWHIETFFLRIKRDFNLEEARVRTLGADLPPNASTTSSTSACSATRSSTMSFPAAPPATAF